MTTDQRPSADELERAHRVARKHQPEPDVASGRKCLGCGDTWPCREYQDSIRIQNEAYGWIGDAVADLPDRYADRLSAPELEPMREFVSVGEWDEALDLLVAILRHFRTRVTDEERDELHRLGGAMGLAVHLPDVKRGPGSSRGGAGACGSTG
ncbi:MAG: hypothetical protein ACRDTU_07035 [Micromonosporaceae bacterium]